MEQLQGAYASSTLRDLPHCHIGGQIQQRAPLSHLYPYLPLCEVIVQGHQYCRVSPSTPDGHNHLRHLLYNGCYTLSAIQCPIPLKNPLIVMESLWHLPLIDIIRGISLGKYQNGSPAFHCIVLLGDQRISHFSIYRKYSKNSKI